MNACQGVVDFVREPMSETLGRLRSVVLWIVNTLLAAVLVICLLGSTIGLTVEPQSPQQTTYGEQELSPRNKVTAPCVAGGQGTYLRTSQKTWRGVFAGLCWPNLAPPPGPGPLPILHGPMPLTATLETNQIN